MLQTLQAAWRARRALILGGNEPMTHAMAALLGALGARCTILSPGAPSEDLAHALTQGRVCCAIIPCLQALAASDPCTQLQRLDRALTEVREAGVPLTMLLLSSSSDKPREGLCASLLERYALGANRGLLGEKVSALCIRHAPALPPPQACALALHLGARFLLGDTDCTGLFDLDASDEAQGVQSLLNILNL